MSNSVTNGVNSRPSARIPNDHSRHDRLLIARFAAGDAYPTEQADARRLVDGCTRCAALAAEIELVRSATAALPAPSRPRDFRLSSDDAERLRGSAIDRLLRRLAAPGLATLRPVAAGAMSLGLALAVVGAALPAPVPVADENAIIFSERAVDMGAPEPGFEAPGEQPAAEPMAGSGEADGVAGLDEPTQESTALTTPAAESAPLRDILVVAGLLLTALALAVLVVVSLARRRWMDPLLR